MRSRTGLTLLEVVVIVIIIAILLGLLLPAVQFTRDNPRRHQCAVNLKNLAYATIQYEQSHREFPGYLQEYGTFAGGDDPANPGSTAPPHAKLAGWPVALLPSLDAQPIYEIWAEDRYPVLSDGGGEHPAVNGYSTTAAADLSIFRCTNSPASNASAGANSYISNNGFDPAHSDVTLVESMKKANGAFNNQYASLDVPKGPAIQLADFADGLGNTLLFSENLQARPWHVVTVVGNGAADLQGDSPLPYPSDSRYVQGMVWHAEDDQRPGANSVNPVHRINGAPAGIDKLELDMRRPPKGLSPRDLARPSSAHRDGVNAGFADGQTRFISDTIDYRVYQALLTLDGANSDVPDREYILDADGQ